MDFNTLQCFADQCARDGKFGTAVAIYLHMAEGDPSLDGGSLGHAIGFCYEGLDDLHAARYWYARAFEENPIVDLYRHDFERTRAVLVDDLVRAT